MPGRPLEEIEGMIPGARSREESPFILQETQDSREVKVVSPVLCGLHQLRTGGLLQVGG